MRLNKVRFRPRTNTYLQTVFIIFSYHYYISPFKYNNRTRLITIHVMNVVYSVVNLRSTIFKSLSLHCFSAVFSSSSASTLTTSMPYRFVAHRFFSRTLIGSFVALFPALGVFPKFCSLFENCSSPLSGTVSSFCSTCSVCLLPVSIVPDEFSIVHGRDSSSKLNTSSGVRLFSSCLFCCFFFSGSLSSILLVDSDRIVLFLCGAFLILSFFWAVLEQAISHFENVFTILVDSGRIDTL